MIIEKVAITKLVQNIDVRFGGYIWDPLDEIKVSRFFGEVERFKFIYTIEKN